MFSSRKMASTKRDDKITYSRTSLEELYARTSMDCFKPPPQQERSCQEHVVRASEIDLGRDLPAQDTYYLDQRSNRSRSRSHSGGFNHTVPAGGASHEHLPYDRQSYNDTLPVDYYH